MAFLITFLYLMEFIGIYNFNQLALIIYISFELIRNYNNYKY